ncbi:MAG: hypothetical protein HY447_00600 [Candidatus Omnitrophica bacterium]|nr:hypothetical protein [Candidatus Omnitrophota bacterium]
MSSEEVATFLEKLLQSGTKCLQIVIGGPDGELRSLESDLRCGALVL